MFGIVCHCLSYSTLATFRRSIEVADLKSFCYPGGAAVWRRTRDQKVAGSTPGRGPIKTTRSTQPSIPLG